MLSAKCSLFWWHWMAGAAPSGSVAVTEAPAADAGCTPAAYSESLDAHSLLSMPGHNYCYQHAQDVRSTEGSLYAGQGQAFTLSAAQPMPLPAMNKNAQMLMHFSVAGTVPGMCNLACSKSCDLREGCIAATLHPVSSKGSSGLGGCHKLQCTSESCNSFGRLGLTSLTMVGR